MFGQLDSGFKSIFGVPSHRDKAEFGATSFMCSSEEEDEEEYLLEEEDEEAEDLEELNFD